LAGRANRVRNLEPFAVVILCTSDPHKLDPKTRSKLSRVLRYADKFKPDTERLAEFVKRHGGINECAAQWSDHLAGLAKTFLTERAPGCSVLSCCAKSQWHDGYMRARSITPDLFSLGSARVASSPASPAAAVTPATFCFC
jgi:hypothetical protein